MEKKCRNGVRRGGKMSGEKPSSRAPILRMEDVLELDAIVTPDTNEILQKSVEDEEDDEDEEEGGETDSDGGDDRFHFENPSSSHAPKTSRLVKKRKKRKLLLSGNGGSLKGYDSFLSEEDISEIEAMGFNNSASFVLSDKLELDAVSEVTSGDTSNTADRFSFDLESIGKKRSGSERPNSEPKKKLKKIECSACSREQREKSKRSELKRSNSQYKSCESDVSNNDSTCNKYYRSPSDVKIKPRKSVDRKLCNCYNRDYGAKKYNNRKYYSKQTSQDHLEAVHSRFVYRFDK